MEKVMLEVFFDIQGVIHHKSIPEKHSINKTILCCLWEATHHKGSHIWKLTAPTWQCISSLVLLGKEGAPLKCFGYSFGIILGHYMVWWPMLLHNTSCLFQTSVPMHHRTANWCCLVQAYLIVLNMGVGFQLCQAQNTIHYTPHGKHLFNWSKPGQNSAV